MINITPSAALKIKQLIESENNTGAELDASFAPSTHITPAVIGLRVAVVGGGCSGFSYTFDYVEIPDSDDISLTQDGCTLIVDPISMQYLVGATLDYKKSLVSEQFVITNPNSKNSCGCGSSFSV